MRLIDADKLRLCLKNYAVGESPSNVESADDRKISRVVRIGEKTYKIPYEMQEKVLSAAEDIRNYFSRILHQGEETNENK